MRKTIAITSLLAAATVALVVTGHAAADPTERAGGSVHELTSLAGQGIHLDYTPLASPADAVEKGDLIVQGTLTRIEDGIQLRYQDELLTKRAAGEYVTFVLTPDEVLDGDAAKVSGGKVFIAVPVSGGVDADRLAKLNPEAKVVAVLDDITDWAPVPGATVDRPAGIPADAPLYAPYRDGLWLQGAQDQQMLAIDAHADELAPAWGDVRSVGDFAGAVQRAATGR